MGATVDAWGPSGQLGEHQARETGQSSDVQAVCGWLTGLGGLSPVPLEPSLMAGAPPKSPAPPLWGHALPTPSSPDVALSCLCPRPCREELNLAVLHAFVDLHEFTDLNLVQALR